MSDDELGSLAVLTVQMGHIAEGVNELRRGIRETDRKIDELRKHGDAVYVTQKEFGPG